jgi:hypothetical protein
MSDDPIQGDDPILPETLRTELSRLYRVDARVPGEVDRAVTNGARAHLARSGRLRLLLRTAGAAAAVAAIVTIFVIVRPGHRPSPPLATVAGDVNGDGVIDIRDAMLLARRLETGEPTSQDFNRDGVTDRRDVDAIAMSAVRLDRGVNGGAVR